MRLPFITLGRDDVITGLRFNVSALQHRLNRTAKYVRDLEAKLERQKHHARAEQAYIDGVKTEARHVMEMIDKRVQGRELTLAKNRLLKAIEGRGT